MKHPAGEIDDAPSTFGPALADASDDFIEAAVRLADPMALRGVLFQLSADERMRDLPVEKFLINGLLDQYRVQDPGDAAMIHSAAAAYLKAHRDAGAPEVTIGPTHRLHESLNLAAGTEVAADELALWIEEIGIDPWARGAEWTQGRAPEAVDEFPVVVIGASLGGLNAAVQLQRAGIPFTVLEREHEVGGTWRDNRYPGARLDTPSRMYTHVFGVGYPYRSPYSPGAANHGYLRWVTDSFGLREHIQFGTEVISLVWDEGPAEWVITVNQNGQTHKRRARAVISAVGFLSQPSVPRLPGGDEFTGRAFHTARWPEDFDATGKRVAVIGTGCTGYQMIPELARSTSQLYVMQRTPNWLYAAPGYLSTYPEQLVWLDQHFPFLANYERFRTAYLSRPEVTARRLLRDPDFVDDHAVSAANKIIRENCLISLRDKLGDRPDLLEKMTPTAPPMAARPVLFDPEYSILDVIKQDDVELISDGIRRITPLGIETEDGRQLEVDAIVYATGFRANDFLWPMEVTGLDGLRLGDVWAKDGARAYLGSMVPRFPNLFMIYGPNMNLTVGLQIIDMIELAAKFAIENIIGLIESGSETVEVDADAFERYNARIDELEPNMVYSDPRANNYYRNAHGRSSANNPIDVRVVWNWLRDPLNRLSVPLAETLRDDLHALHSTIAPHHGADLLIR